MSVIDRVNRFVVGRLRRNAPQVMIDSEAVRLVGKDGSERSLNVADMIAATLYHRDVYASDAIVLRLAFANGDSIEFFQDDPQWGNLTTAIDNSGLIATPSTLWQLQAIADGTGAPPRELI